GLPRVNALAGRFLILRIVVIGGAGTLAESLGVEGDAALVGNFHTGVDGFFASRPQFCSQIRELSVRVTQEGGNRLRLGLGILVLGEGDVEATVGGLRALPLPSRSYGYSVHVTSVGLLLLSELLGHVFPAIGCCGQSGEIGGRDLVVCRHRSPEVVPTGKNVPDELVVVEVG